ncbi:MAG: ABC transporter permease [Caldilineaceae bacterium]|nr:ABC transporter permease [Caldilineaceae bacterium]
MPNAQPWPVAALQTAVALLGVALLGAVLIAVLGYNPWAAFAGLAEGSLGTERGLAATVRKTAPFVLTGLSVALALKAGLFNFGAAGQFLMGSVGAVWVGIQFQGLPVWFHLPLALAVGIGSGSAWGTIPGWLKVSTGAHEGITTIMLNYVAALFAGWSVFAGSSLSTTRPGPLWDPTSGPVSASPDVLVSARIPWILGPPLRIHWGIALALLTALLMWWLLERTRFGFELKTVGAKPLAARYAGMRSGWTTVLAMTWAGGLAGLAGAIETLGVNHKFAPEFGGGMGFEGITIALLGQGHPLGIVLAALLFAVLDAGASKMQFNSGVPSDIIQVVQALILIFVAAPALATWLLDRVSRTQRASAAAAGLRA